MKRIELKINKTKSDIFIGESLQNLELYVNRYDFQIENTIIVTDRNIDKLYKVNFPCCKRIVIKPGESSKTLKTVEYIIKKLTEFEADRNSFVVGIGGGVICDITGFAASIYKRGISFGFVASSLLAQVDAAIGGKNGVNFHGYKNQIGVFKQPAFVICDTETLATLPRQEILCGFAEIIKTSIIANEDNFYYLENIEDIKDIIGSKIIEHIIFEAAKTKCTIVKQDETDRGIRKILNFGHTIGHAIEKAASGSNFISHGQAVSIGIAFAIDLSKDYSLISNNDASRIKTLLKKIQLPLSIKNISPEALKGHTGRNYGFKDIAEAIMQDKKRISDNIDFVLIDSIGHAIIKKIPISKILDSLKVFCKI
jgi:3-dehydroquinate synthase